MKLNARRTLITPASPAAVFSFLGDFRNTEIWDPGTVHCSLLHAEVGPGAHYRNVSSFLGREVELNYATLVYEPHEYLHFRGRGSSFIGDDRLTVSSDRAGTKVTYHATFEFSGAATLATPLVALYLPLLANKTVRQLKESLDALPTRTP
jgi:hypothetical protein